MEWKEMDAEREKWMDERLHPKNAGTLFSVITVCRNSGNVIEKTIHSVLGQTYPDIEYLIIDGASEDETVSIAEKNRRLFERRGIPYIVISESDKGIYDAMNKGIQMASGEVVGFINAGDWYEKDAVAAAALEYRKERFDYFYADINLLWDDGRKIVKHARKDRFPTSRHWNHPASFARKELYQELGLFKCRGIHDDFEFFLRVRKAGKKIKILNKVLASFPSGGASNEKSIRMCRKRIHDRYMAYRENGYSPFYFLECVGMEAVKYIWG